MKINIFNFAFLIPCLSTITPRAVIYHAYDYITGKVVEVPSYWSPPSTNINRNKISESEYSSYFRGMSKNKILRVMSLFYNNYPTLDENNKIKYPTDIFLASPTHNNLFYSIDLDPNCHKYGTIIDDTYTVSRITTTRYITEYDITTEISVPYGVISVALHSGVTFECDIEEVVEKTHTYHRAAESEASHYNYFQTVKLTLYLPVAIEIYKAYNPASYIYYADFMLLPIMTVGDYAYCNNALEERVIYDRSKSQFVTMDEYYSPYADLREISPARVEIMNSDVV